MLQQAHSQYCTFIVVLYACFVEWRTYCPFLKKSFTQRMLFTLEFLFPYLLSLSLQLVQTNWGGTDLVS